MKKTGNLDAVKHSGTKTVAIIPAHNEERTIAKVILQTMRFVDRVLVCDDGSTDMTSRIAEAVGASVVSHERKRGKGGAFKTLFEEVMKLNPDIVVALDADGQHDPDQIPMLTKPIEAEKCDLVVGSRYVAGGNMDAPLHRRFGLAVINFLYKKATGVSLNDTQSGFRAFSLKAFKCLAQCNAEGYGIEGEQLAWARKNGLKMEEVPISVRYNNLPVTSKNSAVSHGADLLATLFRLVVEERPLKLLGLPGIGLTLLGGMLGMFLLLVFNQTLYFSIPLALLTVGTLILGLLFGVAAITLQAIKTINEKLDRFERRNKKV